MPRTLHLIEVDFSDGRRAVHPAGYLAAGEDLAELSRRYLDASRRGVGFRGAVAFVVREATEAERRDVERAAPIPATDDARGDADRGGGTGGG